MAHLIGESGMRKELLTFRYGPPPAIEVGRSHCRIQFGGAHYFCAPKPSHLSPVSFDEFRIQMWKKCII